ISLPGAGAGEGGTVFGTTLRATGRDFGSGTLPFAAACLAVGLSVAGAAAGFCVSARAESPGARVRPAANALDRALDRNGDARKTGIKSGPSRANGPIVKRLSSSGPEQLTKH